MPDPTPLTLLRYLWAEADVPAPGGPDPAGTPAKVRELFSADDPLSIDIEQALDAARQPAPEAGLRLLAEHAIDCPDLDYDDEADVIAAARAALAPATPEATDAD